MADAGGKRLVPLGRRRRPSLLDPACFDRKLCKLYAQDLSNVAVDEGVLPAKRVTVNHEPLNTVVIGAHQGQETGITRVRDSHVIRQDRQVRRRMFALQVLQ
jgi:hypothetical protein